ncbi:unnamed protein product [Ranitomeya imitator]|uniref:N-acetylmuramoyl-L-alanine amidase domain-containing protein n=1 Tax=Ranitomeya imitator TaxID=111125 RepID=A0ABN9LAU0_9NEOB|nr:unnamed protein product [Ranitomeya imitator]
MDVSRSSCPNYNSNSIGISVFGSFTSKNPNSAALNAVQSLISCGVSKGLHQVCLHPEGTSQRHRHRLPRETPSTTP